MNFMSLFRIKDPIYPDFKIDEYKSNFALMQSYAVNRLRFIKQLGLKAYSGRFPSANHTRYEHSIGAMHLSRQFCDQLYKNTQDLDLRGSIKEYGPTIQIAALLHDIGHGPFSHVIDDILGIFGESHEKMTVKIIEGLLADDIRNLDPSIDIKDVCAIILGNHSEHAYLNDVIHGHFDVDRMDYLARDAYFTATEYQWRAYSLMQSMKISKIPQLTNRKLDAMKKEIESSRIPKRKEIRDAIDLVKDLWTDHVCICNEEGVVHAEMMLVTRRAMYENVYYETSSRIAEKMISNAILWMIKQNKNTKDMFLDPRIFITLDDFELFALLKQSGEYAAEIVKRIKEGRFFDLFVEGKVAEVDRLKAAVIKKDYKEIETIQKEIAKELQTEPERVLLDIIVKKSFERNRVFTQIGGKVKPLEEVSAIIEALVSSIEKEMTFGIYVDGEKVKKKNNKHKQTIVNILGGKENTQ